MATVQTTRAIIPQHLDINNASDHKTAMERQLLTTREASELVGVSIPHIKKLLREGQIKGMKLGRDWLVKADHLDYKRKRRPKRTKGENNEES